MRKRLTKVPYECPYPLDNVMLCEPYLLGGDSPVWRFFCPVCQEHHTHGVGPGRRVAHCTNKRSPYKWSGYELRLDPKFA
jgi:hypothetical protein